MSCYNCSVTEVVWETDGVEDVPEAKPAPVPDKVPAPLVASKVAAERYWMVFNLLT